MVTILDASRAERKSYLSSRCAERAVRRHSHGVQVARVTDVIGLQLAVGEIPHLHTQDREHVMGYNRAISKSRLVHSKIFRLCNGNNTNIPHAT